MKLSRPSAWRSAASRSIGKFRRLLAVRTEGDVLIIPVLEEVLVVEKRLVLKEELHVRRLVSEENVEIPVTVRNSGPWWNASPQRVCPTKRTRKQ